MLRVYFQLDSKNLARHYGHVRQAVWQMSYLVSAYHDTRPLWKQDLRSLMYVSGFRIVFYEILPAPISKSCGLDPEKFPTIRQAFQDKLEQIAVMRDGVSPN